MAGLPPQLTPSELLYWERPSPLPYIDELLERCRSLRREGKFAESEHCALVTLDACHGVGTNLIEAIVRIHLADARREMRKQTLALDDCRNAQRIFQNQPTSLERHNQAVATYAIGLLQHSPGNELEAVKCYQDSHRLFESVKQEWVSRNAGNRVADCERIQRWMGILIRYLLNAQIRAADIGIPIIPLSDEEGVFTTATLEIGTIDGKSFRVQPLCQLPGMEYYAVRIPDAMLRFLGADKGDYVLVAQKKEADKEGPVVVETPDSAEFGEFKRDDKGRITFVHPGAAPIVIGGDGDLRFGYITALLKPLRP